MKDETKIEKSVFIFTYKRLFSNKVNKVMDIIAMFTSLKA